MESNKFTSLSGWFELTLFIGISIFVILTGQALSDSAQPVLPDVQPISSANR